MTGAYLRVKRNDKYENVEIEYLTNEEIDEVFGKAENEEMRRWIKFLVNQLYSIATFIDKEPLSD
jgi:hypothetical protein